MQKYNSKNLSIKKDYNKTNMRFKNAFKKAIKHINSKRGKLDHLLLRM